jgi:hypothetical protein
MVKSDRVLTGLVRSQRCEKRSAMVATDVGMGRDVHVAARRVVPPILAWAAIGVLVCGLFAYAYIDWGLSPDAISCLGRG